MADQVFFDKLILALIEIHQSLSVLRTSEAIVEKAALLFGAQGASLMLYDPGTKTMKSASASGLSRFYLDKGPVVADRSLKETVGSDPVVILDTSSDDRIQYKDAAIKEGIRSIIGIPLGVGNFLTGSLRLYYNEPFVDAGIGWSNLKNFASLSGLALKRSFYFSSFKTVLTSIHGMHSLYSLDEAIKKILEGAVQATYALGCILYLVNEDGVSLDRVSGFGLSDRYMNKGPLLTVQSLGEVETGQLVIIGKVTGDNRVQYPEEAADENIQAIVGYPVRVNNNIVGALRFYFEFEFEPDEDDQTYMGLLAEQVGTALEKDQLIIKLKENS